MLFGAEPAKLPEPFQSISDLANAAPPEFAADALLRMVESGKLQDKNARRELVEHAFQLAASAKFPVRMDGLPGTTTDTASGSLSRAHALKLDGLSLQSRAVRDMLPIDPDKARELFGQMVKPALAPLTCDDALVYDPSDYYQALSAVVNGTFTPKEKAKEEHFNLLMDNLGQVTSPSQLAPLAVALETASVTAGATPDPMGAVQWLARKLAAGRPILCRFPIRSFRAEHAWNSGSARKIPAEKPRLRHRFCSAARDSIGRRPATDQEAQHTQAGTLLAIRDVETVARGREGSCDLLRAINYCRTPTAPLPHGSSSLPII